MKDIFLRIFLGFFILLILTRLIGKKQLGQLNVFTYITGIVIGNMAGEMILHTDVGIWNGIFAMGVWTVLIFVVEYVSLKSGKIRNVLDGEPTIIIKRGLIEKNSLKKMRLNIDDLTMLLRTNNVFSITDVDYAILEPNGDLSILKKEENEPVTKKDMNIGLEVVKHIPSEIIADGKIVYKNLKELGKTKEWLNNELKNNAIDNIKDVFYAELQGDERLYIQKNSDQ